MKVVRQVTNRVITVSSTNIFDLDLQVQGLLDIIDSYGGANPYPRFFVNTLMQTERYFYSLTTKIPNDSLKDFDNEVIKFRVVL